MKCIRLHSSTNRRPTFNWKVSKRDLSVPVFYSLHKIGKCYLCYEGWGRGRVSPANSLCFSCTGTGNCPSLNIKTKSRWGGVDYWGFICIFLLEIHHCSIGILQMRTFCAGAIWSSLAIAYASIINYSKTQWWKRLQWSKVSIFFSVIFFLHSEKRAFPHNREQYIASFFFFLTFLFTSNLSIPYHCWWWCFP